MGKSPANCDLCQVPLTGGSWGGYCHDCENQAELCEQCGAVVEEADDCFYAVCPECQTGVTA